MINNRQNGRRRGRGGGGPRPNNAPSPGNNRQDNRSRGNAAQLHEKYKAMARDAQLAGDRVQTEYYLQFADHYFRILNESRARFEEQRRPRDDYMSDEDEDQDEGMNAEGDEGQEREEREEREERYEREPRGQGRDRYEASNRDDRGNREERSTRDDRPRREERSDRPDREQRAEREQPRNGEARPRRERLRRERPQETAGADGAGEERISLDVLPPAIAPVESVEAAVKAPRRRTKRPREGGEEIAPAA